MTELRILLNGTKRGLPTAFEANCALVLHIDASLKHKGVVALLVDK